MAKSTPKIEVGTMFDKNRSLHIERIQRLEDWRGWGFRRRNQQSKPLDPNLANLMLSAVY